MNQDPFDFEGCVHLYGRDAYVSNQYVYLRADPETGYDALTVKLSLDDFLDLATRVSRAQNPSRTD